MLYLDPRFLPHHCHRWPLLCRTVLYLDPRFLPHHCHRWPLLCSTALYLDPRFLPHHCHQWPLLCRTALYLDLRFLPHYCHQWPLLRRVVFHRQLSVVQLKVRGVHCFSLEVVVPCSWQSYSIDICRLDFRAYPYYLRQLLANPEDFHRHSPAPMHFFQVVCFRSHQYLQEDYRSTRLGYRHLQGCQYR